MNKKRWALLVLFAALLLGYFKFFYKTYSETVVAKNADAIVAIDVKRITNTLIWNFITTPSQWKIRSSSSNTKDAISWKDMVEIPDYIFAFHIKDQPVNTWYVMLQIKDEEDFTKGLLQYHFEKLNNDQYISKTAGLQLYKSEEQILVSTAKEEDAKDVAAVANELLIQKMHIAKETLVKTINAKSHLAVYIAANSFLKEESIVTANFNKQKIAINSTLTPNKQYDFTENNFAYSSTSLFNLSFTQPSMSVYNLLSDSTKNSISKAVNFNIDSLLLSDNKYYALDIQAIKQRVDSAITYSYDDNFNKIEKMVVNNVQEPAFSFTANGGSIEKIYSYFKQNKNIETTDGRECFVTMPFVKSYYDKKNDTTLTIVANNYWPTKPDKNFTGILFLNVLLSNIPPALFKYLPDGISNTLSNIESIQLKASKNDRQLILNFLMQKKNNDLPIIKL